MWDVLLSLPGEAGASGQAIVEKLLGEQGIVVAIEMDLEATAWMGDHPAGGRVIPVVGDASEEAGPLSGWVNNATVFRDVSLHSAPTREVLDLVTLNLCCAVVGCVVVGCAVVGCATAVRRFLGAGKGGASVSVSSHQTQRAVPGALPYVTVKAAT